MLRARYFIFFLCAACILQAALLISGVSSRPASQADPGSRRELVRYLGLTDLAIWSEARYTRHPSQADLFTAFQDYPGALDHFPAGSIVAPSRPLQTKRLGVKKQGVR